MLECLTSLAVAATATEHVDIGSCVLQLPLRRPAAVAKQAASLQILSGGRLLLGLGVGSHRGEYEAAGVAYPHRGRLLDEAMASLRQDWAGPAQGSDRSRYRQLPEPTPIPLWVGGSSPAARRRAAAGGDGWVPLFLTPSDYRAGLEQLAAEVRAAGRPSGSVTPAVVVFVHVAARSGRQGTVPPERRAREAGTQWLSELYGIPPHAFAPFLVAGTAEQCLEQIEAYRAAGAVHVVTMAAGDRPLEHFAELLGARRPGAARAWAAHRPELVEVPG
jgi:alkanesulfonate monooxygenase SsuD/methylene tetrahydromethanopterin reductase-like flavin-dependent oxidoreductase (luciferase family)